MNQQKRVVIAGGSGFLGLGLADHLLQAGYAVRILSRSRPNSKLSVEWTPWDGRSLDDWKELLSGSAAVINLAGRTVNCIKTPDHKDEILRSRVESTRVLGEAMRSIENPPSVWVQMSTAHIYGDPPTAVCTEDSAFGYGLAPDVGRAWEHAFAEAKLPEQRAVILRTSFVLGRDRGAGAGALDTLASLARWGLGGRVGSGKQGMSWIHETDIYRLFQRAIEDDSMTGAYIASAPNPVSQVEFARELRRTMGIPIGLPAFTWMVRLGAPLVLRTDPELALYGRYVRSTRLEQDGFAFTFPELREALQDILVNSR